MQTSAMFYYTGVVAHRTLYTEHKFFCLCGMKSKPRKSERPQRNNYTAY